jgi:hypothetical protein
LRITASSDHGSSAMSHLGTDPVRSEADMTWHEWGLVAFVFLGLAASAAVFAQLGF